MSLQKCLAQYPDIAASYDASGINERAAELVAGGATPAAAENQAISEHLRTLRTSMDGMEGAPPRILSTRQPTAVKADEDPLAETLVSGVAAMQRDKASFDKNVAIVAQYPNYREAKTADTTEKKAERFIKHVKENLLWIYNQMDPAVRFQAMQWYDGANNLANRFAESYGVSAQEVGGVIAVMSPQKDWYMNVSLAERVLDASINNGDRTWDEGMTATAATIFSDPKFKPMVAEASGKTLNEIQDPTIKALWIRTYDQTHNTRAYRQVTPGGIFQNYVQTAAGNNAKVAWGSLSEIAKAVRIIQDPSVETINAQLGGQHKVRNFYNNIVSPRADQESVTIDTHAVAAGLLRPLSGNSTEVLHNFGQGASSSTVSGMRGTYGLYAEAYNRAAAEAGILPRQMQSIAWEGVRGLFTTGYKNQKANTDAAEQQWNKYKKGQQSLDNTRKAIHAHANGINTPDWYRPDTRYDEADVDSSYKGSVPAVSLPGRGSNPVDGGIGGVPTARTAKAELVETTYKKNASPGEFSNALLAAKHASETGAFVEAYTPAEYADMKLFLADDGLSGFAIKSDGDIVSVFNSPESPRRGELGRMIPLALKNGGKKLDAFDGFLTSAYEKYGFVETGRDKWKDKFAPEGWDYEAFGRPDVVYMEFKKDGRTFRDFFSGVTEGATGVPSISGEYSPIVNQIPRAYHKEYMQHKGSFDDHIALSIPGYRDFQYLIGDALVNTFDSGVMLDVGASEGTQAKTITSRSKGNIKTVALDPNVSMRNSFNDISQVDGATFDMTALGVTPEETGVAWTEPDGTDIEYFDAKGEQFDIVQESMVFQFISPDRQRQIARIAELTKDNGIAIIQEKVFTENWAANEAKKNDEYKSKYFDKKDLDAKAAEVLEGMNENIVDQDTLEDILQKNFANVEQIWDSGNFKGYAASNSKQTLNKFQKNLGDTSTDFDTRPTNDDAVIEKLFQIDLEMTAEEEAAIEDLLALLPDSEVEILGFDETTTGTEADAAILKRAKNKYEYLGASGIEAAEWIRGFKKFGAEGMTTEARMARAKAMGYNTDEIYYHGTGKSFRAFVLDRNDMGRDFIFVTKDKEFASEFGMGSIVGGNVLPLLIRETKILDHTDNDSWYDDIEAHLLDLLTDEDPTLLGDDLDFAINWRTSALSAGNWEVVETDDVLQQAIRDAGFTGFTVLEGGDPVLGQADPYNTKNTALYNINDLRSVHATFDPDRSSEGTLLAQRRKGTKRGETELTKEGDRIVRLTEASDLSTFLHEAAHVFLEVEKQFANEYGLGSNQEALLKMLGVKSFKQITRREHELFARTFEDYLRTGNAPTTTLRSAFAAFSRWLTNVYRSVKQIGLKLDQEAIDVFDRLLATQAEIDAAAASPEYDKYFESKEQAGMSEAEWKKYLERQDKVKNKAESTVYEKIIAQYTRHKTKVWKDEKAPIFEQEKERLSKTPLYVAEGIITELKLDPEYVKEAVGSESIPPNMLRLVKKGGEDPGPIAEEYGFNSVEAMLTEITSTPSLNKAANDAAEATMVAKYGDILNDGTLEAEVREALHNEEQANLLISELRQLSKKTRKPVIDKQYLKAKAEELVSTMTYSEMKPEKYRRAEQRAAVNAATASTPGQAYEFKVQQLANHQMYIAVNAARQNATRFRNHIKGVQGRTYRGSQVDPEYINNMKQLAKSYDMTNRPKMEKRVKRAQAFLGWLNGQIVAGVDINLKDISMLELQQGGTTLPSFDEMTFDQLRSTYEMLKHMRFVGGKIAKGENAELMAEREAAIDQAIASGSTKGRDKWKSDKSKQRRFNLQHTINLLPSLRNLVRTLDGDPNSKGGAFFDMIIRRVNRAEGQKLELHESFYGKFDELMGDMDPYLLSDTSNSVREVTRQDGSKWALSARQRFMLATYWGTESSRQRVRDGFSVTDAEVAQMLAHLGNEELEMVKVVWKHSDHMMGPLFAAAVEREGVAPSKLVHTPFVVNGVSMPGGHMRLFYGESTSALEQKIRLDENPLNVVNSTVPSVSASAKERADVIKGKKLLLDTSNIFRNIEENIHFIAYSTVATELQTVFNNKEVRDAIAENHGEGFDRALLQNIQGLTTNYKESEPSAGLAAIIRRMRNAKSMMYLAYNLKNITQQFASVIPAGIESGPFNYVNAATDFFANYADNVAFVEENSAQMRGRKAHLNREQSEIMAKVVTGSKAEKAFQTFAKHGFSPHVVIDQMIAYPLWKQTFLGEMNAHGDKEKATINADVAVAETVGSGMDIHVGKVFRSNENSYIKMLTVFGSWFNSSIFQRAYKGTMGGKKFLSKPAFSALVISPFLTMMISEVIVMNIWKGEDEDDPFWKWAAKGYGSFMGATVPVVGDLVSMLTGGTNFRPSTLMEDAVYGVQQAPGILKGVADGDTTGWEVAEDFIKLAGSFIPMPGSGNIVRALDFADAVQTGEEEIPDNVVPFMRKGFQAVVEGSDKNPRR